MSPFAHAVAGPLVRGTLEATAVLALVLLLCRGLRSFTPEARGAVAWLGTLKVLVACAGLAPLALPVLPAPSPEPVALSAPIPLPIAPRPTSVRAVTRARPTSLTEHLPAALLALWALGVCVAGAQLARRMWRAHALRSDAVPNDDSALESLLQSLQQRAGVRRRISLRLSIEAPAPFVSGAFRPVIVLPLQSLEAQSEDALAMALAHEVAHVRRLDLWLGWIPALARVVLWFHPFAHLATREYLQAREEACDAEAVRLTSAEPADYGQLLLSFGVIRDSDASATAHGASPAFRHLHRRLQMLENVHRPRSRIQRWGGIAALGACVALLPVGVGHAERNPAELVGEATAGVIFPEDRLPDFPSLPHGAYDWSTSEADAAAMRALAARMEGADKEGPISGTVPTARPRTAQKARASAVTVTVPQPAPASAPAPAAHVGTDVHVTAVTVAVPQPKPLVRVSIVAPASPAAPARPPAPAPVAAPARPPAPAPAVEPDEDHECPKERARREGQARVAEAVRSALPAAILQELEDEGIRIDSRINRALARVAARTAAVSRTQEALQLQAAALERAEQELTAQQSEQETRRAQLEQKRSELEADEDACPDQVRELERAMHRLERGIAAIERTRDHLEQQRDRFEEKRAQLEEQRQSLEELLHDALDDIDQG